MRQQSSLLMVYEICKLLISRQAVVALIGPRQVGKMTLALEIAQKHNGVYLDLESMDDRHQLTHPSW